MKIIGKDNFDNEAVADRLIAENITDAAFAKVMCDAMNAKFCNDDYALTHYAVVNDNYRLSKGMEDLV